MISVIVMNLYLLSLHAPVPKKNKYTDYLAFRQALYKALFQHLTGAAVVGAADTLPVAGSMSLMLPPGDTVPMVNNPDTKDRAELAAAAAVARIAGEKLVAAVDIYVEHQRVSMKRAPCVMCKQAAKEGKRGIGSSKSIVFQALSPNIVSERKDRHVTRAKTGCSSCNVALCSTRGCWEAFHSGAMWGRKLA